MLASLWHHRFFHRDLTHFLQADAELAESYQQFVGEVLTRGEVIYRQLRESGMLALDDEQLQGLMVNTWVIMSSWAALVHGLRPDAVEDEVLDKTLMRHGVYQIICLEEPYLAGEAREHADEVKARYCATDDPRALLLQGAPSAV